MTTAAHICVYCASSTRIDPAYSLVADDLGMHLAKAGHTLVWGGGSVGLMGRVAQSVQTHGGKVVGVIPQFMIEKEWAYLPADELVVTQTMRERKQIMEERSDFFIVLPGGFGTLEEFFEILTLRILDCHTKHIVIINTKGFYDELLTFIEKLYALKFASDKYRELYQVVDDPAGAMSAIAATLKREEG